MQGARAFKTWLMIAEGSGYRAEHPAGSVSHWWAQAGRVSSQGKQERAGSEGEEGRREAPHAYSRNQE